MPTDAVPASGAERASDGRASPSDSKLARLLETETRLERRIAEARRRAEELIEEAELEAQERRGRVEARLDGEAEALRGEIEEAASREIESIRDAAARRARRYRGATDEGIDDLAGFVVRNLVSEESASGGPR